MLQRIFSSACSLNTSLFFIGLMFLLPFINIHYQQPIPTFYTEWIAATLGLAAVLPLLSKASCKNIKIPLISLVPLGLGVILGIQWMLHMLHSTQYALLIFSYFVWAYLLTLLGATLRRELGWEKLVTSLAYSLVIAGMINVAIVVLQFVIRTGGSIPLELNIASYGAMTQRNLFADFVALAIASLMYLYVKGRFSLSFFTLILTCFLIILALSGSRSSWLHLSVLTVLAIVIKIYTLKKNTGSTARNLQHISFLLLPMFMLVQLFIYYVVPEGLVSLPTERLIDAANASTPSARLHILYDSMRLFLQSPWLGTGIGSMRAETFLLIDIPASMATKQVFEHAHNLFLHLLAEMGIGAFLLVCAGLVMWLRAFKWRELNLETWWVIALVSVLGIHSIVEFPLWFTFYLGIAAILLGAGDERLVSVDLSKISRTLSQRLSSKQAHPLLAIILVLGVINLGTMFVANAKLENWIQQWINNNEATAEKDLEWVSKYSLLSPYAELMSALSLTVNSTDIDRKLLLSQSAMRFKPLRRIAYKHALLLDLKGNHVNAVKQLHRALVAYPPTKIEDILAYAPPEYRQNYLDLLAEANLVEQDKITTH